MSSILTGIFSNNNDYKKLEQDLENIGIPKSDYIVYLNNKTKNYFLTSVQVSDNQSADDVEKMFNKNNVNRIFLFDNMNIKDAASYEDLLKRIEVRINLEVSPTTPSLNIKELHEGIQSST